MSVSLLPFPPPLARIFGRGDAAPGGPLADLKALFSRIEQRSYPETIPVLASWWLKTIYVAGHNRAWWTELDAGIAKALRKQFLNATAAEAVRDTQQWIRRSILPHMKTPEARALVSPPFRRDLTPEQAAPYVTRVLNEWLPAEVARLLAESDEDGMPPLVVAKAIEGLLLREHFPPTTLELLLDAATFSPQYVYPAHAEIFADIILCLLGRTAATPSPVLPAIHLAGLNAGAPERASLVGGDLHVPLDQSEALELLTHDSVHIGSILVTMDGRWWQSDRLQSSPETGAVIIYRPGGRLAIDFTADHARLMVPWPDPRPEWAGEIRLPERMAIFGREWRGRAWERGADRTWLHLEFTAFATLPEAAAPDEPRARRLRPAADEMAWSEVEQALATADSSIIDQLRREELIPLTHALRRLTDALLRPWPSRGDDLERSLASVRYLHAAVAPSYGLVPWRVLPAQAAALLQRRGDDVLRDVFEDASWTASGTERPRRVA